MCWGLACLVTIASRMLLSTPVILSPVYLGGFTRSNCMCGPFQLMRELRILIKKLQCRKTFKRLNLLTQRKEKFDGFGTHETLANITVLCRLHSLTFHKLQPCDVATFGLLQTTHRDQANEWSEEVSILSARSIFLIYTSLQESEHSRRRTPRLDLLQVGCSRAIQREYSELCQNLRLNHIL
jgi:hypothetical protein